MPDTTSDGSGETTAGNPQADVPAPVFTSRLLQAKRRMRQSADEPSWGVFRGGTALRLFYGNVRYSEDMDFVFSRQGAESFSDFPDVLSGLDRFLLDVFPFATNALLKAQKDTDTHKRWVARLAVAPLEKALAVRIEAVNVPSYDHRLLILPFPPFNPPIRRFWWRAWTKSWRIRSWPWPSGPS